MAFIESLQNVFTRHLRERRAERAFTSHAQILNQCLG